KMNMVLEDISKNPSQFISLLPSDWEEGLASIEVKKILKSKFYVLKIDDEICAGGVVFPEVLSEMDVYKDEASYLFSKGYLYVGYVWVPLEKRGKNYGTLWLNKLLEHDLKKRYWLTIEDAKLKCFYEQAGFEYVKTL